MSKAHVGFNVRPHNPWRYWLLAGIGLIGLGLAFYLGRVYQSYELVQLKLRQEVHQNRIAELELRNAELVRRNAQLEGDSKIEHDAYVKANDTLVALQKEMIELREQLVFYQGIVSPEELALGVNIQSFELLPKNDQGLYAYKLVLTKRGKSDQFVKGNFDMMIRGHQADESVDLNISRVQPDYNKKEFSFSFRYFQVFEGEMVLPEGFEPFDIELAIKPSTRKLKDFTENISWVQALTGGEN